ncbi:MAG: hypothetical protein WCI72_03950 [archaeon]
MQTSKEIKKPSVGKVMHKIRSLGSIADGDLVWDTENFPPVKYRGLTVLLYGISHKDHLPQMIGYPVIRNSSEKDFREVEFTGAVTKSKGADPDWEYLIIGGSVRVYEWHSAQDGTKEEREKGLKYDLSISSLQRIR